MLELVDVLGTKNVDNGRCGTSDLLTKEGRESLLSPLGIVVIQERVCVEATCCSRRIDGGSGGLRRWGEEKR